MKKTLLNTLTLATLFFASAANAQVGVGLPAGDIHPSAELEVKSTTKGFLPPRMTKAERLAMVAQGSTTFPAAGLLVFQTDGDANEPTGLYFFDGTAWRNGAGVQGIKGDRGETGAQGLTGATGLTGTQGLPGAQGQNTLTKTTIEAAGANCIAGGVKIEYGYDANNSGTLDVAETSPSLTKYVCNGLQGPIGAQGLPGASGPAGASGLPSGGRDGQIISICDGLLTWTTGGICPGKIASLNCAGVSVNGSLNNGAFIPYVSFVITYSGGDGGPYEAQSISSTSVVGLTANLQTGSFATGNGSLTFTVSGTPTSEGNALFSLTIAGQVCSISMVVQEKSSTLGIPGPVITDIEGNTYKTVNIGTQQWMAENLKVSKYSDGTTIPNITDDTQWSNMISGAWSYYNNDATYNTKYGKLYNFYALSKTANGNKNICPTGWHVPEWNEWWTLIKHVGGGELKTDGSQRNFEVINEVGGKMKEVGTSSWKSPNTDATNTSLFTGLSGGYRTGAGSSKDFGLYGLWWIGDTDAEILLNNYNGAVYIPYALHECAVPQHLCPPPPKLGAGGQVC